MILALLVSQLLALDLLHLLSDVARVGSLMLLGLLWLKNVRESEILVLLLLGLRALILHLDVLLDLLDVLLGGRRLIIVRLGLASLDPLELGIVELDVLGLGLGLGSAVSLRPLGILGRSGGRLGRLDQVLLLGRLVGGLAGLGPDGGLVILLPLGGGDGPLLGGLWPLGVDLGGFLGRLRP